MVHAMRGTTPMTIGIRRTLLVTLTAGAVRAGRLAEAQGLSESTGVAQFRVAVARDDDRRP
jgi:hypothetical protein